MAVYSREMSCEPIFPLNQMPPRASPSFTGSALSRYRQRAGAVVTAAALLDCLFFLFGTGVCPRSRAAEPERSIRVVVGFHRPKQSTWATLSKVSPGVAPTQ